LIDEKGVACITDYGLASIANETILEATSDAGTYLSPRWTAPELLDPENSGVQSIIASKSSDIYSYAMVMLEVSSIKEMFPVTVS
jgi:serine/threonine protein kinase